MRNKTKTIAAMAAILTLSLAQARAAVPIETQKAAAQNFSLPAVVGREPIGGDAPIASKFPIELFNLGIGVVFATKSENNPPPCENRPNWGNTYTRECGWAGAPGHDMAGNLVTRSLAEISIVSGINPNGSANPKMDQYVWWPTAEGLRHEGYELILLGQTVVLRKVGASNEIALGTLMMPWPSPTSGLSADANLRMSVQQGPVIACGSLRGHNIPDGHYGETIITLWNAQTGHKAVFKTLPAWYNGISPYPLAIGGDDHSLWPSDCRP